MSKVTTKLQLTVPKAIADRYGIRPGDEVEWVPAGETIRVVPVHRARRSGHELPVKERLALFDQATKRQQQREAALEKQDAASSQSDIEAGRARAYTFVVSLVDTNILVYRFDSRFPQKQRIAAEVLRSGLLNETLRIPHQALLEFVAVVTRVHRGTQPLLNHADARREAEELLIQFTVLSERSSVPNSIAWCSGISIIVV